MISNGIFILDFSNAAEYWTFPFETYNIRQDMENVWNEVLPLYELIHAYVRRRLREYYGPNRISRNAPLPAHVSLQKSEKKITIIHTISLK